MIKRNIKGQFVKGNDSGKRFTTLSSKGNQHAKGNPPNKTSFKKGEFTMGKHPSWKGGIQKHKDGHWIMLSTNKRVKLARYIYEQVHGGIPQGHVIYHIDGDIYNDDYENLIAITRSELIVLNNQ